MHPQEWPSDVSSGKLCLAHPIVDLWEFLMSEDTCLDPGASLNLATTAFVFQVSHFFDHYNLSSKATPKGFI